MDLRHIDEETGTPVVKIGVDLTDFYLSVEWDILDVPAVRYCNKKLSDLSDKFIYSNHCYNNVWYVVK